MEVLATARISRSAAAQRAGRAGRTAPGEVWRLYSEADFDAMAAEPTPEIARCNLAHALLLLKSMGIARPAALEWLDPPPPAALVGAARQLYLLDAIDVSGALTADGRRMARLPLEPCLARFCLAAARLRCVRAAAAVGAMACGEEPYVRAGPPEVREAAARTRARLCERDGDHLGMKRALDEWAAVPRAERAAWCREHGLHGRALATADEVRRQLLAALAAAGEGDGGDGGVGDGDDESRRVRRALCEGYFMNAARRMRGGGGFVTVDAPTQTVALRADDASAAVAAADYVVFAELVWAGKPRMRVASPVDREWLAPLLPRLEAVDTSRLLGAEVAVAAAAPAEAKSDEGGASAARRNDDGAVEAARARFLARKRAREA